MELPSITASSYTTTGVSALGLVADGIVTNTLNTGNSVIPATEAARFGAMRHITMDNQLGLNAAPVHVTGNDRKDTMARRLVRIIIADTADTIPLDMAVIYNGPEKLTDLEDKELFFEIPVMELLAKHNEKRVTYPVKRGGKEMLEPARIRDLRMNVVTIATF